MASPSHINNEFDNYTATALPMNLVTQQSSALLEYSSNVEAEACEKCKNIFTSQNTAGLLKSQKCLEVERLRRNMAASALKGCPLCRELLCMPYFYDHYTARPNYQYQRKSILNGKQSVWPLKKWAKWASSQRHVIFRFLAPKLRFVFRGDLYRQSFLTASCLNLNSPGDLIFQATTKDGEQFQDLSWSAVQDHANHL
jgi:hypothetical protein